MTQLLAVLPQMGMMEYEISYPVRQLEYEDGTRVQRINPWSEPRYRFSWTLFEELPVTAWSDIWEFYKDHKGQQTTFYMAYGYPIPDINIGAGTAGQSTITVTDIAGLTINPLVKEGKIIHLGDQWDNNGEVKTIRSITGSCNPYTLTLDSNLSYTYDSTGKIRHVYEVIFEDDNLEIDQAIEKLLTTGLIMVTP